MNKPLTSWKNTLRTLGYKVNWKGVLRTKRVRELERQQEEASHYFQVETLEPRQMLSAVSGFEGTELSTSVTLSDVDFSSGANYQLEVNLGDGSAAYFIDDFDVTPDLVGGAEFNADLDLNYGDDGAFNSTVTLLEDGLAVTFEAISASIANVAPIVELSGETGVITPGSVYEVEFNSVDPGDDTVESWLVDWGDGTIEEVPGVLNSAQHIYDGVDEYAITVTATDEDGAYAAVGLTLDSTFGEGGKVTTDFFGANDITTGSVVQADGKIIVVGTTRTAEQVIPGFGADFHFSGEDSHSEIGKRTFYGDEFFSVDTDSSYKISTTASSGDGAGGNVESNARSYLGYASYDIDKKRIVPYMYLKHTSAQDTTLVVDLVPGATEIVLADGSGWYNGSTAHVRSFAWYSDSTGQTYEDYGYTRSYKANLWNPGGVNGNVITLKTPWTGPTITAGSAVRNAKSGGTFNYALASNLVIPEAETVYSRVIGGHVGPTNTYGFRPGTAFIKPVVLANWSNGTTNQLNVSDFNIELANPYEADNIGLVRYNTDGTLDQEFGYEGKVSTDLRPDTYTTDGGRAVILQDDGKIIVAGRVSESGQSFNFALVRYNVDGTLDTTFGDGDGIVTTDIEGANYDWGMSLAMDGDKIVVAGRTYDYSVPAAERSYDFGVARYNGDGSIDTTFGGGDGTVVVDFAGKHDFAYGVAVQSDSKILVSGMVYIPGGGNNNFGVLRLTENGDLDDSFGPNGDGKVTTNILTTRTDAAFSVLVKDDNSFFLTGYAYPSNTSLDFVSVSYSADGVLNANYGNNGVGRVNVGAVDVGLYGALQPDGRVVVAGYSRSTVNGVANTYEFSAARFTEDGQADSTFGNNGWAKVAFGGHDNRGYSAAIADDGGFFISGYAQSGENGFDYAVAKFLPQNTLVSTDLVVTTLDDEVNGDFSSSDLSLREAVLLARRLPGNDTITFSDALFAGGARTLDLTYDKVGQYGATGNYIGGIIDQIVIDSDLEIQGPGSELLTISGLDNSYRIFEVSAGVTAAISGLSLVDGGSSSNYSTVGFLGGGAIFSAGNLSLDQVVISGSGTGGAIYQSGGSLDVNSSTFASNSSNFAGAVYATGSQVRIENSTFSNNYGTNIGGVYVQGSTSETVIANSTFVSNRGYSGGAIKVEGAIFLGVNLTAFSNGGQYGGAAVISTAVDSELHNSVLVGATESYYAGAVDLSGNFDSTTSSHNLIGNTSVLDDTNGNQLSVVEADVFVTDAGGVPILRNNGGPTETIAIKYGGLAIDAGDWGVLYEQNIGLDVDQRGFSRIVGLVDIGATEFSYRVVPNADGSIDIFGTEDADSITVNADSVVFNETDAYHAEVAGASLIRIFGLAGSDVISVDASLSNRFEIYGGAGNDTIHGAQGDDRIAGGDGDDLIYGGSGADDLSGGAGDDLLRGGLGDDQLDGGAGEDELAGEEGDDVLVGGLNDDELDGGIGDDQFVFAGSGSLGHDHVLENAGEGVDSISFAGLTTGAGVDFDLSLTGYTQQLVSGSGNYLSIQLGYSASGFEVENVRGTEYSDRLVGNSLDNDLSGGLGNDQLYGGLGEDSLHGGDGDDTLDGGYARVVGGQISNLYGGAGDDVYLIKNATGVEGEHSIEIDDIGGNDTLDFSTLADSITVDLESTSLVSGVDGLQIVVLDEQGLIENVVGTAFSDTIFGNSADNILEGGDGDDVLLGREGNDIIIGDAGLDNLEVVDQADSGFVTDGADWVFDDAGGFNRGQSSVDIEANVGIQTASWSFDDLLEGEYEVYVTWQASSEDLAGEGAVGATNALFEVTSGAVSLSENVNQRQSPSGLEFDGTSWQRIGESSGFVSVASGASLTITLSNASADGLVYADAIRVVKYNHAPVLGPIGNQVVAAGIDLNVPLSASDFDGPSADLTFELSGNSPVGMVVVPNGNGTATLLWPDDGSRSEGEYTVTIVVSDQGTPGRIDSETFVVQAGNVANNAPAINGISNLSGHSVSNGLEIVVDELVELSFDIDATDDGLMTYSLAPGSPLGASIDASGHFVWLPTEGQSNSQAYEIEIRVTDDGSPRLRTTETVTIWVDEVNEVPVVGAINLLNDTGVNSSDLLTIDPTITGFVSNDGSVEDVEVMIDFDNDGIFEGFADVVASETDPGSGTFTFDPAGMGFFESNGAGGYLPISVSVVAQEFDVPTDDYIQSPSSAVFQFTLDENSNIKVVTSLELKENIGTVSQPVATNPTILGVVVNADGPVNDLQVFIYDVDPVLNPNSIWVGKATTDDDGNFEYVHEDLTESTQVDLFVLVEERTAMGGFPSDIATIQFDFVKNLAPEIVSLQLNYDSGDSSADGVTSDTTVSGQIAHADGSLEGVFVEFDDDNDGEVDGSAVTDSEGKFVYRPVNPTEGTTPIGSLDARVVEWDDYQGVEVASPWLDDPASSNLNPISLTYDESSNSAPRVLSLDLLFPNGGGEVADPTVWGTVSNDSGAENVAVEFSYVDPTSVDFDRDTDVVGATLSDETGRFEFTPGGKEFGVEHTIYARAIEWDPTRDQGDEMLVDNAYVENVTFTISETPFAIDSFSGIQLAFDTGTNGTNLVTSDPTLVGSIQYEGNYDKVLIEFDHDGDGLVDGTAVPDADGNFQYLPLGLLNGGLVTIRARAKVADYAFHPVSLEEDSFDETDYTNGYTNGAGWDNSDSDGNGTADFVDDWFNDVFSSDGESFEGDWYNSSIEGDWNGTFDDVTTDWASTMFTLDLVENNSPAIAAVEFANPDAIQTDPTIQGTVTNDGRLAGTTVEIYLNGNTEPDGSAITDEVGDFQYTMQGHLLGNNDVVVRIVETIYGSDSTISTDFGPFVVGIDGDPQLGLASLELYDSVDGLGLQALDPTLIGQVNVPEGSAGTKVLFDYDGDGVADGESGVDGDGVFEFTPEGLTLNGISTTVNVQVVVESDENGAGYRTLSHWQQITWEVIPNSAPQITNFELKYDNGLSGGGYEVLDRVTSDPSLVGQVVNDNSPELLVVEFDHDGDGVVDGTATTDENGSFEYIPEGLSVGGWDILARTVEFDPTTGSVLEFDYTPGESGTDEGWAHITELGDPLQISEFNGFTLVGASASTLTELSHSGNQHDPTITGSVTDSDGVDNLIVEFYLNGGSEPIGTTTVNPDGSFTFTPFGMAFGSSSEISITAVAVELDYATGERLEGTSTASPVSFDFQPVTFGNSSLSISISQQSPEDPFDPSLKGTVFVNEEFVLPQFVEIDFNGDGVTDDVVAVEKYSESGFAQFSEFVFYYLPELESSSDPVVFKARPVGSDANGLVFGSWGSTSIDYDLNLPSINQGWTVEDENTPDPKIVGVVNASPTSAGTSGGSPIIEFDYDGDGNADEAIDFNDSSSANYSFEHQLYGLEPGTNTVFARVIRFETITQDEGTDSESTRSETVEGEWQELTFDLLNPAPQVVDGSVELINEIGDEEVPESTDPFFRGNVTSLGTDELDGLRVEFDHNGDGNVDAAVATFDGGRFEHSPETLEVGLVTVLIRVVDTTSNYGELAGDWHEFTFNLLAVEAPVISGLELSNDEGESGQSASSDPILTGIATVPDKGEIVTIQFDHDGDGIVDGEVQADLLGVFTYEPSGLSHGENLIRSRGVTTSNGETIIGEWLEATDPNYDESSVSFFFISSELPVVSDLQLEASVTGEISGRVTVEGYGANSRVEVAVVGAGGNVSNGIVETNSDGYFTYTPQELLAGTVELVVRGLLADPNSADSIEGEWQAVGAFSYAPDALPSTIPGFADYGLANDTGHSDSDKITANPTIRGEVTEVLAGMVVEFSYDAGGVIEAVIPVSSDGSFEFSPEGLSDGDTRYVDFRIKVWDPFAGDYVFGSEWASENFTLDSSADLTAKVSDIGLLNNLALEGQTPITNDPTIVGQVVNDGPVGGLLVQFDHDGDGTFDGQAFTQSDGSFVYRAVDLEAGASVQTISAVVVETRMNGEQHVGEQVEIEFVLNVAPLIVSLEFDANSGVEGEVAGTILIPGDQEDGHVEYVVFGNYEGSSTPPASLSDYQPTELVESSSVDEFGDFVIDLASYELGFGIASVIARAVDDENGTTGPWTTVLFEVTPANYQAFDIEEFELVEDTGSFDDDQQTSNATVKGLVGQDGDGAYGVVELTYDVAGGSDPTTFRTTADAQGRFEFTPYGLDVGNSYSIEARHVVYDPATESEVSGTPEAMSFTLLDNNNRATILNFDLKDDAQPISDPTLVGTVQDDGRVDGLRVEFDTNNDEEVDGFTYTDALGNFEYTLFNIPANQLNTVRARVVEWDGVAEEFVSPDFAEIGANGTATFTLDDDGPIDPELDDSYIANPGAVERADSGLGDAVNSHLGSIGEDGGESGRIDVGFGTVEVRQQDSGSSLGEESSSSSFDYSRSKPTSDESINQENVVINSLATDDGGEISANGTDDSSYSFAKSVTINGDTVITEVSYSITVANYQLNSHNNGNGATTSQFQMSSTYSFTLYAQMHYGDDGKVDEGYFSTSESSTYSFMETSSWRGDGGFSNSTVAGSQTYAFSAHGSIFDGNLNAAFTVLATNNVEAWQNSQIDSSYRKGGTKSLSRVTSSGHAAYSENVSNIGVIDIVDGQQTVSGMYVLSANATSTGKFDAWTDYSTKNGNYKSSGRFASQGSGSNSSQISVTSMYTTGLSVVTQFSMNQSQQSNFSSGGSGRSSYSSDNSSRNESWSFSNRGNSSTQSTLSGRVQEFHLGPLVTTQYSGALSVNSTYSGSGKVGGNASYQRSDGNGNSSQGSGASSVSYSSSSVISDSTSISGNDDSYSLTSKGNVGQKSNSSYQSSGTSQTSSANGETNSASRSSGSSKSGSQSNYSATRTGRSILAKSSFSVTSSSRGLSASQTYGTRVVSDGNGGTKTIAFRSNSASTGKLSSSYTGKSGYSEGVSNGMYTRKYQVVGDLNSASESSSKASSFSELAGRYDGFSLTMAQNSSGRTGSAHNVNNDGDVSRNGNYSRFSNGSSDNLTVAAWEYSNGNSTTSEFSFQYNGREYSDAGKGIWSQNSEGRTHIALGASQGSTFGTSLRTTDKQSLSVVVGANSITTKIANSSNTSAKGHNNTSSGRSVSLTVDGKLTQRSGDSSKSGETRHSSEGSQFEHTMFFSPTRVSVSTESSNVSTQGTKSSTESSSESLIDGTSKKDGEGSSSFNTTSGSSGTSTSKSIVREGTKTKTSNNNSSSNSSSTNSGGGSEKTHNSPGSWKRELKTNSTNNSKGSGNSTETLTETDTNSNSSRTTNSSSNANTTTTRSSTEKNNLNKHSLSGDEGQTNNSSVDNSVTRTSNSNSPDGSKRWKIETGSFKSSSTSSKNVGYEIVDGVKNADSKDKLAGSSTTSSSTTNGFLSKNPGGLVAGGGGGGGGGPLGGGGGPTTEGYHLSVTTTGVSKNVSKSNEGSATVKDNVATVKDPKINETITNKVVQGAVDVYRLKTTQEDGSTNTHNVTYVGVKTKTITQAWKDGGDINHTEKKTDVGREVEFKQTKNQTENKKKTVNSDWNNSSIYSLKEKDGDSTGNAKLTRKTYYFEESVEDFKDLRSRNYDDNTPENEKIILQSTNVDVGGSSLSKSSPVDYVDKATFENKTTYTSSHEINDGKISGGEFNATANLTEEREVKGGETLTSNTTNVDGGSSTWSYTFKHLKTDNSSVNSTESGTYKDATDANGAVGRQTTGTSKVTTETENKLEYSFSSSSHDQVWWWDHWEAATHQGNGNIDSNEKSTDTKEEKYGPGKGGGTATPTEFTKTTKYNANARSHGTGPEGLFETTTGSLVINSTIKIGEESTGSEVECGSYRDQYEEYDHEWCDTKDLADGIRVILGGVPVAEPGSEGYKSQNPNGGIVDIHKDDVTGLAFWWGALTEGLYNYGKDNIVGGDNIVNNGYQYWASGQMGRDIGDRSLAVYKNRTGRDFTGETWGDVYDMTTIMGGEFVGTNSLVEGIGGYDLATSEKLGVGDRIFRGVLGAVGTVGFVTGGLGNAARISAMSTKLGSRAATAARFAKCKILRTGCFVAGTEVLVTKPIASAHADLLALLPSDSSRQANSPVWVYMGLGFMASAVYCAVKGKTEERAKSGWKLADRMSDSYKEDSPNIRVISNLERLAIFPAS